MPSNYLFIVSLGQYVAKFAFIISAFFGTILIFLTLFGVRKIFGTYKYLMMIFTSFGILMTAIEQVFHPNLHFYNNGFVFFTFTPPFGFGKTAVQVVLSVYAGVYSLTISLLAVQFVYRYSVLFSLKTLAYFRGWKSLAWISYCSFFGGIWWLGAYVLLDMDKISEDYFKEEMLLRYNISSSNIPMMTFLAFDPIEDFIRWWDVLYTVNITSIMGVQYSIMMYCGWKMKSKMEEKLEKFSATLRHHHRQLFKTLVLQITAPTVFLFSPLVLLIYLPYFHLNLSFPAGAAICAFSLYPAMDSIIVLIVVSEYRLVAKRLWKALLRRKRSTQIPKTSSSKQTTLPLSTL